MDLAGIFSFIRNKLEGKKIGLAIHLGDMENLTDISSCITRLRLTVWDPDKVNETELKRMGAAGIIIKGAGVQASWARALNVSQTR